MVLSCPCTVERMTMEVMEQDLERLKVVPDYNVDQLVAKEFSRLKGQHYLDHAAATLYGDSQLRAVFAELESSLLGNPHSRHSPSDAATQVIETIRQRILEHFNTSAGEYDIIFTSGATAALKVMAESFDWSGRHVSQGGDNSCTSQENSKGQNYNQSAKDSEVRDGVESHRHLMSENVKVSDQEDENGQVREECFEGHNSLLDLINVKDSKQEDEDGGRGVFVYTRENHTSVLGIRGLAHHAGCDVYSLLTQEVKELLGEESTASTTLLNDDPKSIPGEDTSNNHIIKTIQPDNKCERPEGRKTRRNCLLAFSGQCNFSGAKSPLSWVEKVQAGGLNCILKRSPMNSRSKSDVIEDEKCAPQWFVVLDAAGLVATSPLDLSRCHPDFVPVSFYKMFGYPTGLGCLLVGRRAWDVLRKSYQGGGTVMVADARTLTLIPRSILHQRFEDGTLPYLSIMAVRHGLDAIAKLTGGMERVRDHTFNLARYTHHSLRSLRHACGSSVVQLYCPAGDVWHTDTHGPIVNFNLLQADGSFVGYAQVERVASLYNIHLRTGCLCNPGACQTHLAISEEQLLRQFEAGHVCGDAHDLVDGQPTGAVRVSFGYMSTYADADQLLKMVRECFVQGTPWIDTTWMRGLCDVHLDSAVEDGSGKRSKAKALDNQAFSYAVNTPDCSKIQDTVEMSSKSVDSKSYLCNGDINTEITSSTTVGENKSSSSHGDAETSINLKDCSLNPSSEQQDVKLNKWRDMNGEEGDESESSKRDLRKDITKTEVITENSNDSKRREPEKHCEGETSRSNQGISSAEGLDRANYETEDSRLELHSGAGNQPSLNAGPSTNGENTSTQEDPEKTPARLQSGKEETSVTDQPPLCQGLRLTDIILYPVKSCGRMRVGEWRVGRAGLEYDRRWMVVTEVGVTLTQKRLPLMSLISPHVDLASQMLVLRCQGEKDVRVPLTPNSPCEAEVGVCGGRVCGDRVKGEDCGKEVGEWLSKVLGVTGLRLMKQTGQRTGRLCTHTSGQVKESLSLVNESQVSIVHRPSVRHIQGEVLAKGVETQLTEDELVWRFRPNLVVEGGVAYEEDSWSTLTVNGTTLHVQGGCRRCQMVCVSPTTGQRTKEPMLTLATTRGSNMRFGVHTTATTTTEGDNEERIVVGSPAIALTIEAQE